jgi:DNA-3-methyladenine glycosylase
VKQVEKNELPGKLLSRPSLEARPERVARLLLGKILIQMPKGRKPIAGRIVEVEAYLGPHSATADPAAHSHRGPTPRNQVIFGPAGHAYVYSIYGMYYCMNVTCEREGQAGCILIRALEPLTGLEEMARNRGLKIPRIFRRGGRNGRGTDEACGNLKELTGGPSRLCQALGITRSADNGLDLLDPESPLQLRDDGTKIGRVLVTRRIGIRHAVELPLRFLLAGHVCVSGPKSMNSASVFPVSSSVR